MIIELAILSAILIVLGLATFGGYRIYTAVLELIANYQGVMQTQRDALKEIATVNIETFRSLCAAHQTALGQTVNAHSTLLHDVGTSHAVGAAALGGAAEQLLSSARIIESACTTMSRTANDISKILNVEFVSAIQQDLAALKRFMVPRN